VDTNDRPQPLAYDLPGAAAALSVTPEALRAMIRRGVVPAARLGRRVLVRAVDLEALLAERVGAPPPPRAGQARGRRGRFVEAAP